MVARPDMRVTHVMTSFGPLEIREQYVPGQGVIRHAVTPGEATRRTPPKRKDGTVGYDLLALSGGGSNGAFGAGVLHGWTKTGKRPTFQIVTGISAGSLLSSFAFAGPQFDDRLRVLFTTMTNDQIFRRNSLLRLPWSDSLARTDPLARLIEFQVDSTLLAAVAKADAEGRRLYVGTTHLDHKKLVIWDMGSIAASGHPGAAELYGRILLASSAIPVVFNPVEFRVQSGGKSVSELHVDGGTRAQVFLRSVLVRNLDPNPDAQTPDDRDVDAIPPSDGPPPGTKPAKPPHIANLRGTRLWIIVNGKLQADPVPAKRDLLPIAADSLNAMMYAKASGDLLRLYFLATTTHMDYKLLAIPQETQNVPQPAEFDPARMTALFEIGSNLIKDPSSWLNAPRGLDETEMPLYDRDEEDAAGNAKAAASFASSSPPPPDEPETPAPAPTARRKARRRSE